MAQYSALINVMVGAARKAARGLARDFGEVENLQVSRKGPADFVSTADLKAEKALQEELIRVRPKFSLLMEEEGKVQGSDPDHCWIVDPLDGTTNFLHGVPHFAISIGLQFKTDIIAGVVYNPITDELYWAEKGRGAYLNDRRLKVAARRDLSDSLLATGIPFRGCPGQDLFQAEISSIMGQIAGIRRFGAASLDLAYVAAGRFDGFWERNLKPWDVAAGLCIVREAGGFVSTIEGDGDPLTAGSILAANDLLKPQIAKVLLAAGQSPQNA